MSAMKQKLLQVSEDAQQAFWAEVAKQYPGIKTGDMQPEVMVAFAAVCDDAILLWCRNNSNKAPK